MGSESPVTISLHVGTFLGIFSILALLLKQHKIWTRIKDRLDQLWADYCEAHGIKFTRIENGKD
jgi:hypothetical protein